MYGVVLWSDVDDRKAVIWCEDHGDLAFYSGQDEAAMNGPNLDTGDLVHFQVSEGQKMRLASNPRLIAESQFPKIAEQLRGSSNAPLPSTRPARRASKGNVVAFKPKTPSRVLSMA